MKLYRVQGLGFPEIRGTFLGLIGGYLRLYRGFPEKYKDESIFGSISRSPLFWGKYHMLQLYYCRVCEEDMKWKQSPCLP